MIYPAWLRCCFPAHRSGANDPSVCVPMTEANGWSEVEEYVGWHEIQVAWRGCGLGKEKRY